MAFGFPVRRVVLWGGLATAIFIGQQVGFLPSRANPKVDSTGAENNVLQVHNEDKAIAEARDAAIAHLGRFLEQAANPPESWEMTTIKVALQGSKQIENIWVSDFRRLADDQYIGKLGNNPVNLPGLKAGDAVEFTYAQINDWAFVEGGKGYGFYSVRAMLPMMEEDQANGVRGFLAPEPLPAGW